MIKILRSEERNFPKQLARLARRQDDVPPRVERTVRMILNDVRSRGDRAVLASIKKYEKVALTAKELRLPPERLRMAYRDVNKEIVDALRFAAGRILAFHKRQKPVSWSVTEDGGITLGQLVRPLEKVGLYIPGGRASYPSSVLMNALPATVAGVERIVMCTPAPQGVLSPPLLVAADICGVKEIYQVGGAQAIGAMAYGTETIPRVDKIVGPGNIYVTVAKRMVYGTVDIDMLAGPSELVVIADKTADPVFVTADLLSQAEHDPESWVFLLTPSRRVVEGVRKELRRQLPLLDRRDIARASLSRHGYCIQVRDLDEAIDVANALAPEHLELAVENHEKIIDRVRNAGAVFVGHYTPETVGDYVAGPNHVLPTGGTARFSSPLSVEDFVKKSSLIGYSPAALKRVVPTVERIAAVEGLTAHARAVQIRFRPLHRGVG